MNIGKWGQALRTALALIILVLVLALAGIQILKFGINIGLASRTPIIQTGTLPNMGDTKVMYLEDLVVRH